MMLNGIISFSRKNRALVMIGALVVMVYGVIQLREMPVDVDELLRDPAVDQPTLGLILCRDQNRLIAEYALRDIHKPIGVAGWETRLVESLPKNLRGSLPTIEELEAELSRKPVPMKPPKRRRRTDA